MHLRKPTRLLPLLLLLLSSAAPSISAAASPASPPSLAVRGALPPTSTKLPAPTRNPAPGTADAPVDGQDGKPHSGPNISPEGPPAGGGSRGLREIGVSGGVPSVDLDAPPPVTGEHEIFDVEGKEGTGKTAQNDLDLESSLSKSITTDDPPKDKTPSDHDDHDHADDDSDTLRGPPVDYKPNPSFTGGSAGSDEGSIDSPMHSFTLSFLMIIFSEIGDKTFLIAALMAMKHSRLLVFSAALCSLIVMSILSALLGHAVPTLIPKRFTSFLAAGLFFVFGARMLKDGLAMEKGSAGVQEEMKEVEQELEEKEALRRGDDMRNLEEGGGRGGAASSHRGMSSAFKRTMSSPNLSDDDDGFKPRRKPHKKASRGVAAALDGVQNLAALVLSPAWVQTFVMTFLGEWGDRSQIATIAMAAGQDYWWVTVGSIAGHSLCTAGAVIGGRFLAEKISVRNVTLGGSVMFLIFGVLYLLEALYM